MAFHADKLTTALVTTHLPLASVPKAITPARVATATFWLSSLLAALALEGAQGGSPKTRGTRQVRVPKVVVAGLNPHAGEGGLLGREETSKLVPGMTKARERLQREGLSVELLGPVPAESAFRLAAAGAFDGVVAMYHDQATIPMKLVGFGEAVNVSLGLPIVRTSVDHGTAYDRAPLFQADARGMVEALALAGRLVRARHLGARPRA
jgi:4-hydroxythreonine-4-phosphate dehydrogenase